MKKNVFSDEIVTSIDIGTTKICVLIARCFDQDNFEIIGIGKSPSEGLKKGVVVDIAKTIQSIKAAVKEAELMAGCSVGAAHIGISGGHIQSCNSQGMIPIKRGEIVSSDIAEVIASARTIVVPEGQQILHVLPQFFMIDGRDKVLDPLGMHAIRLEAQVHIITGSVASVQNLIKCCEMAGIMVKDIVLEQLASAHAVLTDDERQLGVVMIDIGGGTCDVALFHNGSIRHTMVLPVAGNHVTHDIAIGLRTTINEAERIKKEYGVAYMPSLPEDQCIELTTIDGITPQVVLQTELASIIQPRMQEMFVLINQNIIKNGLKGNIPAGIVLTGGGSLVVGAKELASIIFNLPVRIGIPRVQASFVETIESPQYATGYGLLLHALKKRDTATIDSFSGPMLNKIMARMKAWVSEFF